MKRQWKILGLVLLVSALAAFFASAVQNVGTAHVVNFFLFGTPNPYISPAKEKKIQAEFKNMIEKEFGVGIPKGLSK